ncbi:hypothetical protein K438DRAFT_1759166 [Mycena galopus ATCC 62051]|nr:hypothetical protein K438DRAFT_1759166 [Mycena galopus ATCC 62051]
MLLPKEEFPSKGQTGHILEAEDTVSKGNMPAFNFLRTMDLLPHSRPEFTVVSTTNNAESAPQPEFEPIRLGNIMLQKEFKEMRIDDQSGIVGRQSRGTSVRRVYTAELRRDPGCVTVAMYEGDGAEQVSTVNDPYNLFQNEL